MGWVFPPHRNEEGSLRFGMTVLFFSPQLIQRNRAEMQSADHEAQDTHQVQLSHICTVGIQICLYLYAPH